MEDIYDVTDALASLPSLHATNTRRKNHHQAQSAESQETLADLEWPPSEEEFIVALEEDGWRNCSVISFDESSNTIRAHQLEPIKTRAKDDYGRTYWIYSEEESVDTYEEKHILAVRPSIS